jgi:hypothetical protein
MCPSPLYACGKQGVNPKKTPEISVNPAPEKAYKRRRRSDAFAPGLSSKVFIYIELFPARFILDTPPLEPYYAARKF